MSIGERLGNDFEILELLQKSSFGNTYRARQLSLHREVAVRVLDPKVLSEASLGRFLADSERLIRVDHPNVQRIFSLGWHGRTPFVVMELRRGRRLSELGPEIPTQSRLHILNQAARGLGAVHAAGVVHRAVSPASVLVGETTVHVFDLGLAAKLGQLTADTQEGLGNASGEYLSPEQISDSQVTAASDVFSFGIMLYEVLAGVHPFHAAHPMTQLNNIMRQSPAPPQSRTRPGLEMLGRDLADRLDALTLHCLEKAPDRRPADMTQVSLELDQIEEVLNLAQSSASTIVVPKVLNPYGKKVMIRAREDFFGRVEEVRRIFDRLNADPPESVAVVGERKIGKSSLLNYVYMRANREQCLRDSHTMIMVFLDFQRDAAWTIELFSRVLLETISLEAEGRLDLSRYSHDLPGVRDAVEELHRRGFRLTILLDEFDRVASNSNFPLEFFAFLRSLAQHYNVAYVTASIREVQELCHDQAICDSPFFNIFSTLRLGPFRAEEARKLICKPSSKAGRPLEPHAGDILELAGELPFFLQMACSVAFDALREQSRLDLPAMEHRFMQEAEPHFRAIWDSCLADEQQVLKAIAGGKRMAPSQKPILDVLGSRGYVTSHSETGPRLFGRGFESFVRAMPETRVKEGKAPVARSGGAARRRPALTVGTLAVIGMLAAGIYTGKQILDARKLKGSSSASESPDRGRAIQATGVSPEDIPAYAQSYALVIGAGTYSHGWPSLPGVSSDVLDVAAVLKEQGFQVETILDPDQEHLRRAFQDFISRRGLEERDRLLFYFAGHGYTRHQSYGEDMGYIVPTDAPDPAKNLSDFLAKAISMDQIATYARAIQSRHALFVFDACFAGSIFTQSRSAPGYITFKMDSPVRQFITSGDANETVPDRSIFRREFVAGLRGEADQNRDGYITGSELGEFLLEKVVLYSKDAQHPRQGKLRDPNLDKGDFVFTVPSKAPGQ